jgi:hypothetical protein
LGAGAEKYGSDSSRARTAVPVERLAGVPRDPVVQRAVAGPGVESENLPAAADEGHVCDATYIKDSERLGQVPRQGGVIDRNQRGALPSRGNIGRAKIVGDRQPRFPGQPRRISHLPGPAVRGLMQDGLSMEADDVGGPVKRFHGPNMVAGQTVNGAAQARIGIAERRGEVQDHAQIAAQLRVVGQRQRRPERSDPLAIGVEPGGIDAVQRGSAHEADNARHLFPCWCVLTRVPSYDTGLPP